MKKYALSFQKNIRDLGGLKVKDGRMIKMGRLFRGGALLNVKEEDLNTLLSFHLTDIVDFRSDQEFINRPDYQLRGVKYHNIPLIDQKGKKEDFKKEDGNLLWFIEEGDNGFNHLKKQYVDLIISEKAQEGYRKFFDILLQDNKVTYFHCSQGKDRAGLAAYLIESALGVDFEDIKEDYLLSNEAMKIRIEKLIKTVEDKPFYNEEYKKSMYAIFSAKIEYFMATVEVIDSKYGGVINYLKDVLKVDIDRLKDLYLE